MKKVIKASGIALAAIALSSTLSLAQEAAIQTSTSATVEVKKGFFQTLRERFTREKKEVTTEMRAEKKEMMDTMKAEKGEMMGEKKEAMKEMKMEANEAGMTLRLQTAVKAGVITQAEADTVIANRKVMQAKEAENKIILDKIMTAESKMKMKTEAKAEVKGKMMDKKPMPTTTSTTVQMNVSAEIAR